MAKRDKFLTLIEPHFDAGYNLARWLTRNEADAADVFQDASFRAFRFIDSLNENPRPWFIQIVRNCAYTHLKKKQVFVELEPSDDVEDPSPNAESLLIENVSAEFLRETLDGLDLAYREVLVLRELEDFSYEEISKILEIPVGTVMSRLSRARALLKKKLLLKGGLS